MTLQSENFYDVIVGGGSVSGLLAAREISSNGYSVLILEEDHEIGTPEHCGGVVSQKGLEKLGVIPRIKTIENYIKSAIIKTKNNSFQINSENQHIIVIDRRSFDKELAFQAQTNGAEINTRSSITSVKYSDNVYYIKISSGKIFKSTFFVEARGISHIIKNGYRNIIPSGQYEIYAPWIQDDTIEVEFDAELYPGFFAWIVPTGDGQGKVGVAGRQINPGLTLEKFLEKKGKPYSIIRKIYAPLWVNGYIKPFFVKEISLLVTLLDKLNPQQQGVFILVEWVEYMREESISNSLNNGNDGSFLKEYQSNWINSFGKEFDRQVSIQENIGTIR